MCKRSEPDPLLRLFVDLYNLHLLAIPRENSSVGDLYVHDGRRTSAPGSVTHFLTPRFTLPPVARDERMADVAGTLSQGVDVKVGLGLLEGFLTAMGGGGLIGDTKAEFVRTGTRTLRFRFGEATRDSIDPLLLGGTLTGHAFDKGNAVHGQGYRYYLVTAVVRSRSIGVTAERERTMSAELNVQALKVADVDGGVTIRKSSQGEVTFAGDKALAFGVELYELVEGEHGEGMRLRAPESTVRVRGRRKAPLPEPAFIGGMEGDAFLTLG